MEKYPKFMISLNKKTALGRIFLLHTGKPGLLAEIISFHNINGFEAYCKKPGSVHTCSIGNKIHTITAHIEIKGKIFGIFVIEFFEDPTNSFGELDFTGLMHQAAEWLRDYFNE